MTQTVSCNICQNNEYTIIYRAGIAQKNQIVKCNSCGLMYVNPRQNKPDVEYIKDYDPNWFPQRELRQRIEKEAFQIRDYNDIKIFLNQYYPQKGTLIEIGSGFGYLLNSLKQDGWEVKGIEPLQIGCQYTKSEFNIEAIPQTLEDTHLEDNSVDIFVMLHVIEHLADPTATLKEIFRILKPNGLLILETPRYDTVMFKLLGKRERSISCEGHIYFFTTDTIKQITANVGFETVKIDYVGRSLTLERFIWNLGVISRSQKIREWLKAFSVRFYLNKVKLYLNFRDMQRVYLKKS